MATSRFGFVWISSVIKPTRLIQVPMWWHAAASPGWMGYQSEEQRLLKDGLAFRHAADAQMVGGFQFSGLSVHFCPGTEG